MAELSIFPSLRDDTLDDVITQLSIARVALSFEAEREPDNWATFNRYAFVREQHLLAKAERTARKALSPELRKQLSSPAWERVSTATSAETGKALRQTVRMTTRSHFEINSMGNIAALLLSARKDVRFTKSFTGAANEDGSGQFDCTIVAAVSREELEKVAASIGFTLPPQD